jgi:signal transduction histidine kinase
MAISIRRELRDVSIFGKILSRLFSKNIQSSALLDRCLMHCRELADERNSKSTDFTIVVSSDVQSKDGCARNVSRFFVQTPFWALIYRLKANRLAVYLLPSVALANPDAFEVELHLKLELEISAGTITLPGRSQQETLTDHEFRMLICAAFNDLISRSRASFELDPITERIRLGDFSLARGIRQLIHERRQLLESVMMQNESMQNELARNIHDDLIGDLLLVQTVLQTGKTGSDAPLSNGALSTVVSEVIAKLRGFSHDLSSRDVKEWGLGPALDDLASRFTSRTGINYRCNNLEYLPEFSEAVEIQIYRVIQESFTNSWKHAQASNVSLDVVAKENEVAITVCDDGLGIALPCETIVGRGLSIMKERVAIIDAQRPARLTIGQAESGGTATTLRIKSS